MSTNGIKGLTENTMEQIKSMVSSNTVIGDPIAGPNGTVIIPVSKINVGFGSGGLELDEKKEVKIGRIGGGSGGGLKVEPVAFLVITKDDVKLLQIADKNQTVDRALNLLPGLIDKISSKLDGKEKGDKKEKTRPDGKTTSNVEDVLKEIDSMKTEYKDIDIDFE